MKKKYLKILSIVLIVIAGYLYLAHTYIYRRIGYAHLPATDDRHTYVCEAAGASSTAEIVYAALGDSLTAGVGVDQYEKSYPYLLAQHLVRDDRRVVHKNFSYPGARTQNLIDDLLEPAIAEQPDVVTVLIGTNDIHGLVSVLEFEKNYDRILEALTTRTDAQVYAVSIPRIGSDSLFWPPYNYYFDYKVVEFNAVIKKMADRHGVRFIDLDTPTAAVLKTDGPHYSVDLFHPSSVGCEWWAKLIYDNIDQ